MRCLLLTFLLVASINAEAAVFKTGTTRGMSWVSISGDIEEGDDKVFARQADNSRDLFVFLESDGGRVLVGERIAEIVNNRQYATVVPQHARCASICGAIWLSGSKRYRGRDAKIGFHSTFIDQSDGVKKPSLFANRFLGRYFKRIGLKDAAIRYLMPNDPNRMSWLTDESARQNDIFFIDAPTASVLVGGRNLTRSTSSAENLELSDEEAQMAGTLMKNFNVRFDEAGMSGIRNSIGVCYDTAIDKRLWRSAVYCSALNTLAAIVDGRPADNTSDSLGDSRIDELGHILGVAPQSFQDRGRAVALAAASKFDTTRDPFQAVAVEPNRPDNIVEQRSAPSSCSSIASKVRPFDRGLSNFIGDMFCGSTPTQNADSARKARLAAIRRRNEDRELKRALNRFDDPTYAPTSLAGRPCVRPTTPWDPPCR